MAINADNLVYIISILIIMIVAAFAIVGVVIRWSSHQDDLNNMVTFCIKYLIESKNIQEKIDAAKALGHAKDPAALLVLVDVINDRELQEKDVHHAAIDALYEMSSRYKKYNKLILVLLTAIEQKQYQKIIDLLIKSFEQKNDKKYVQSAYVIAREYIKLQQYDEARVWLHKAEFRNRRSIVYIDGINELIKFCNYELFLKGDSFYHSQKYFEALEYYSLASCDLNDEEKQRFCDYLRVACVYYKLKHYNDASEATLVALQHNQGTDDALLLEQLLQKLTKDMVDEDPQFKEQHINNIQELDKHVAKIMHRLSIDNITKEDSLAKVHH